MPACKLQIRHQLQCRQLAAVYVHCLHSIKIPHLSVCNKQYKVTLRSNRQKVFCVSMVSPQVMLPRADGNMSLIKNHPCWQNLWGFLKCMCLVFSITSCLEEQKVEAWGATASFWHARGERWGRAKKEDKFLRLCGVRETFFFFSPQTFYELSLAREKETGTRSKTAWSLTRPSGKHFSRLTTSLWSLRTSKLTHIIHVDWREPRHTPWNWSNTHQRYFIYWTYYFNFWDYRMSCYNSSWYSALQKESALSNIHSNHLKLIKFENAAVDDS